MKNIIKLTNNNKPTVIEQGNWTHLKRKTRFSLIIESIINFIKSLIKR